MGSSEDSPVVIPATTNYQKVYLDYEFVHRHHPHWPLADLKAMTPRQRKYWREMGEIRTRTLIEDKRRIMEKGGVPIAAYG